MRSPTYNLYKLNLSSNFGHWIDRFRFIIKTCAKFSCMKIKDTGQLGIVGANLKLNDSLFGPWTKGYMGCYCGEVGGLMLSGSSPEPGSPLVLFSFFHFMRRFWNHILIWRSVRHNACAISIRLLRVRYRLKWNSFSSSSVWYRVYVCRPRFRSEIRYNKILII